MEVRGVKALHIWIKRVVSNYSNITIVDFSSSFRSGLVFCAIIHHFRPSLIDFDNLSADNVYFNNSLAFNIAENILGIPSLLDPQDMVDLMVPDRYSIITYVSQFYHKFKDDDESRLITFYNITQTTCPAA